MYQSPPSLEALRLEKFQLAEPKQDMEAAIDILIKHYKHIDVKEVWSFQAVKVKGVDKK